MKVLISAYACKPGYGSEQGVGWNWALQATREHEVWVITRRQSKEAIEAALDNMDATSIHFVYHEVPYPWSLVLHHRDDGGYLHYYVWQATALTKVRKLHRNVGFDLAHHITYAGFRFPSFLCALRIPYVWGPVGGGDRAPWAFLRSFGWSGIVRQLVRDISNVFAKYDPLVRATARGARVILAATPATRSALPKWAQAKTILHTQSALEPGEVPRRQDLRQGGLRTIYLGRLLYLKGLHFGLEAIAQARRFEDITLTLVASGPEEARLHRLATRLGIADAVQFTGFMPRDRALQLLAEHDCFLFPSFQDSASFAVLEAMAAGLPVVCLNAGGPALSVTDQTGIRVEARTQRQLVSDLAQALTKLAREPDLRHRMGAAGQARIAEMFEWDHKAKIIKVIYEAAVHADSAPIDRESRS